MTTTFIEATPKQIKAALAREFAHSFSVTRGRGTGSRYIHVRWIDGPTYEQVDRYCAQYNDSQHDDLTTDLWCGSQYTSLSRSYSIEGGRQLLSRIDLRQPMPAFSDLCDIGFDLLMRSNRGSGTRLNWVLDPSGKLATFGIVGCTWPLQELGEAFAALGLLTDYVSHNECGGMAKLEVQPAPTLTAREA